MASVVERTEDEKRQHRDNADKPATWVLEQLADEMPEVHARAYLVGRWVWVGFDARPDKWITMRLYGLGFRWNPRRMVWQHACGWHSKRSPGDPRLKYGVVSVGSAGQADDADTAVA